ncbi:RNA polymerase sigma factor [Myxococcota bacterium]|nr:RNA polymerase sigma factor [Myxococcota bacterium]
MKTSTQELVAAIQAGDQDACEILVRRYYRPCYAVALAILRHPEDAEDVAQSSLLSALSRIDDLRDHRQFKPWLMKITRNRALTDLSSRKKTQGKRSSRDIETMPADHISSTLKNSLLKALEHLSDRERDVLLFHDLCNFKHAEIAEFLLISETNSRQILFTARGKMRALIESQERGGKNEQESH